VLYVDTSNQRSIGNLERRLGGSDVWKGTRLFWRQRERRKAG
jgi:hypothetical protein